MKNNFWKESLVSLGLVIVSVLLLNPFKFWMPDMMVVVVLAVALVLFGFLSSFIVREKAVDERDAMHRMLSGRVAFLSGSTVLLVGIIVQALSHKVDFWLVLALVVMVLGKFAARVWSDRNM